MQPQPPRKLQLEIPANLNGVYANAVIVSHTYSEIVLDFIQIAPNDPRARVQTRVVMTPANAKLFLQALGTNLERFEAAHGEIKLPPQPASLADQLFGGIKSEEGKSEADGGQPQ
ncbi:MAG: DUF3467 domain-containing protein [Chloroflexi bacterium]|nr:DUF3467 domain-containing protein [Chloroflexota bacterium]